MSTQDIIGFDTETDLIGPGNVIPKLACASFAPGSPSYVISRAEKIRPHISWVTAGPEFFVAHNAAFDISVILRFYMEEAPENFPALWSAVCDGRIKCTLLREKLLNLADTGDLNFLTRNGISMPLRYNLAALAKKYLGRDRSGEKDDEDGWRLNYDSLAPLPVDQWPAEAVLYACEDAEDARNIYLAQEVRRAQLQQETGVDPLCTEDFQVMAAFALNLIAARGMVTDAAAYLSVREELDRELSEEKLQPLVLAGILNPAIPAMPYKNNSGKMKQPVPASIDKKALVAYMEDFSRRTGEPLWRTDKTERFPEGQISTAGGWFEETQGLDPILDLYTHRQSLQKLVSTELPRTEWPKGSGILSPVVWTSYDPIKSTGRTSSAASKNYPSYNSQNADPRIRKVFVPRPGFLLCSCDYTAMELCTLGQTALQMLGKSTHIEMINQGIDNHAYLGAQLAFHLNPDFTRFCNGTTDRFDIYQKFMSLKKSPDEAQRAMFKHYRTFAKPTGLGYPGGLGAKTFIAYAKAGYGITVSLDLAKELKKIWFVAYPEMQDYFDAITEYLQDDRNVGEEREDGRKDTLYRYTSPLGMLRSGCRYTEICNGLGLQTPSAEGAKFAVWMVTRACFDPSQNEPLLYGRSFPTAFIHDEILAEVPIETAHESSNRIGEIMCEAFQVVTPDVKMKANPVLMRRWDKAAEPVFGDNGKLIPWEDREK